LINGREYVAHDCGSAIYDKRIDIYMSSHERALEWGVQNIEIFKVVQK
jgi:3D (Asp-Asp-Asp) domain-containing protein